MRDNHYRQSGSMSQRKAWSQVEDSILKDLYENKHIKRWSEIARIMECDFHIRGRNGKQCRERYHNHLDDTIRHDKWTPQEEQDLAKHHDHLGNRWAELSRYLPGRSENDIKNQFYSILRRGLRQINSIVRKQLKRYKELEVDTLYKITEGTEGKRRGKNKDCGNNELKRIVMYYAFKTEEATEDDASKIKKFIEQVKCIGKSKQKKDSKRAKSDEQVEQVVEKAKSEETPENEVKLERKESEEEQIDSAQYRDNCPMAEVKKEHEKFRKNSFFNFTLQQPEMEIEVKSDRSIPYKLRKRSSFYSNHSFDLNSPRWNELDPSFKAFEMQETDNFSPKPQFYATSPYFDQSKTSYWSMHEFH